MLLLIDQGNSRIKWCYYINGNLQQGGNGFLTNLIDDMKSNVLSIAEVLISSVKSEQQIESLCSSIKDNISVQIRIASSCREYKTLKNGYNVAAQLGIDRWLAMIAVWEELRNGFMVVDAGSALTLDVVDATGIHQGGHIIPGLSMQKKILLTDAERVKFGDASEALLYQLGTSTAEAVVNGCLSNLCSYITQMYQQYSGNASMPLILTGGDAMVLSKGLLVQHQVLPNLVLQGLYYYFYNTEI